MQADWEFELGPDAPVIEAHWAGFVDLRSNPERASELAETAELPALAAALMRLNGDQSPVWTSKCDFYASLAPGEFDKNELDATAANAAHATACYIDLLSCHDMQWAAPANIEADCKVICERLSTMPLRCCRADLVIRSAAVDPNQAALGITAYITACGSSTASAVDALSAALAAFADSVAPSGSPTQSARTLQ